jgi:glycosyltransferase involved in cell wall biosynthesis
VDYAERKRVAVFAPSFPPAFLAGGPARSLDALVAAGAGRHEIVVLTSDRDLRQRERLAVVRNRWIPRDGADIMYVSSDQVASVVAGLFAVRRRSPSLIYWNSFFNSVYSILPHLLWRTGFWGRPLRLLAPRGEMGIGALGRRSLKKRVYMATFRLLGLHRGLVWHASSVDEANDIRSLWGDNADIVIRENETRLPDWATSPAPPGPGSPLRAVYLARIVEHKGLAIALAALQSCTANVTLDIYGSEEDPSYAAICRQYAASLPANVTATFMGPIGPDSVRPMLADHDVMVMPTAGENFAHSIAESLSSSCVVVASHTTPWTKTLSSGGGYVVHERSVEAWRRAFAELEALTSDELLERRVAAKNAYDTWKSMPQVDHVFEQVFSRANVRIPA